MERSNRIKRNGYVQIVETLKSEIRNGEYSVGQFIATEKELQERFSASRSTIRKALRDLVEEGFAINVPYKGVFVGRGLAPNRSRKIAFIENGNEVQQLLFRVCSAELTKAGYQLEKVGGTCDYPLEYALEQVKSSNFAGAIVWGFLAFPDPKLVESITRRIPVIAIDHRLGEAETDVIGFDHYQAAYDATTHLIEQGHQRIGLTGMIDTMHSTVRRMHGYMEAMFANRLQPNPNDFVFLNTSGMQDLTSLGLERMLRSGNTPDAFLNMHDFCSPLIAETALRCGYRIPEDIALASIGDDFLVSVNGKGMTSVSFDWEALAQSASQLMLERLSDLQQPPITNTMSHKIIVRGLCGTPDPRDYHSSEISQSILPHHSFTSTWSVKTDLPRTIHQG